MYIKIAEKDKEGHIQLNANYANALRNDGTTTPIEKGSINKPVYFLKGKPEACGVDFLHDCYATCDSSSTTTSLIANASSYALIKSGIVCVKFANDVAANSTININNTGAKKIYYKQAQLTKGVICAGDIGIFVYDGEFYRLISLDRDRFNTTLIPYGIKIAPTANMELNNSAYLAVGNYYCPANENAKYITDLPGTQKHAFMMQVYSPLSQSIDNENSTWVYRIRKLLFYTGIQYIQQCHTEGTKGVWTYGNWVKIVDSNDYNFKAFQIDDHITINANQLGDTLKIKAGSNIELQSDITNKSITINSFYNDQYHKPDYTGTVTDKQGTQTGGSNSNIKIGTGISGVSDLYIPVATGTTPGATIVYPAASCTTYTSDYGTVTPKAVQKGAKMFSYPRLLSSEITEYAIPRIITDSSNKINNINSSKIESTGIKIESVTNTKDSSKKAHVISIPAEGSKKIVYGYCTDQVDGTSFIGGLFKDTDTTYPYDAGLAIGGTSGNLLWKGKQVATTDMSMTPTAHTHPDYVNQNAFSNVKVGSTIIAADTPTDTLELVAGTNIMLTPDATNDKITITCTATHPYITTFEDTNDTASPEHGLTFTTVDDILRDSNGHVLTLNTKTITLPEAGLHYIASGDITATAGSNTSGSYLAAKWKVADVDGITAPTDGMSISLRTPAAGNSGGILLSIDGGTTYYPIVRNVSSLVTTHYSAGSTLILTFNSTSVAEPYLTAGTKTAVTGCWQVADYDKDTTYTNAKLGHVYVTCDTAAATKAKTATLSSYTLTTGGIVAVKFTNGITVASPTLNISSKGAKNIYYRGAELTDTSLIKAGDTVTFIYSTQYHIISIDRDNDTKNTAGSSNSTSKMYLIGATSQSATGVETYSHTGVHATNGELTASKVYGAVWNDYAEYRQSDITEAGRVICENGDDTLSLANERLQPGANIISDTFGFAIGETDKCKTPVAVSGRVLAYPYEDRESFKAGDPVCAGPNGTVSKMTREEVREYPDRMIGTVSAIPGYETWGTGNVSVNGRIWIKIK